MSRRTREAAFQKIRRNGPLFAALGDETRLMLVIRLSSGSRFSIASLARDSSLTRQAITKHLLILQQAGLVQSTRRGRENLFQLRTRRLDEARRSLERISRQWDESLSRLKSFVESKPVETP